MVIGKSQPGRWSAMAKWPAALDLLLDFARKPRGRHPQLLQQRWYNPVALRRQRPQQMQWFDLLLPGPAAEFLRRRKRLLTFHGEFV
jgi:hypothetical protein